MSTYYKYAPDGSKIVVLSYVDDCVYWYKNEGEPVAPCMDVYREKIQSDGSLDKLKLRIVVRGDLQNKELVGVTWLPTSSMRTLKYFLADATKHKPRVQKLYLLEHSCKPK